jgi:hypothetical protein
MRVIQPLTRTFRRQLQYGSLIFPARNWILRRIAYLYGRFQCLLNCEGDIIETVKTATNVSSIIRLADTLAKETYVWNEGSQVATIFENEVIVARVQPGARQRLPVSGKMQLRAVTDSATTSLRITTLRRCLCGDDISPYESGAVIPTMGDLI